MWNILALSKIPISLFVKIFKGDFPFFKSFILLRSLSNKYTSNFFFFIFIANSIPNGAERVKKVVQTLY